MALTANGTQNLLTDNELPTGYTRPSVTTFTDFEYESTLTLSILKATVENATASTTMTNIIGNSTIGIDKQLADIILTDFLLAATGSYFINLTALTNNFAEITGSGDYLTNTAASYTATVTLFVKVD